MTSTELIPRATVEEIVAHRNKALELYREAFAAIAEADYCIKAAHAEAALAAGDCSAYVEGRPHEVEEVQTFMDDDARHLIGSYDVILNK